VLHCPRTSRTISARNIDPFDSHCQESSSIDLQDAEPRDRRLSDSSACSSTPSSPASSPIKAQNSSYEDDKLRYQRKYFSDNAILRGGRNEEIRVSPLFTLAVQHALNDTALEGSVAPKCGDRPAILNAEQLLPQYGLLGFNVGTETSGITKGEPVFMNVDAPSSTFICGSQGEFALSRTSKSFSDQRQGPESPTP
jgi:hypothetical protein